MTHLLKEEYLNKHDEWFEGRSLYAPSTNNCLEATNNVIKSAGTLRCRLQVGQFFGVAKRLVREWSIERDPASV